jgi:hypothetical protein
MVSLVLTEKYQITIPTYSDTITDLMLSGHVEEQLE